MFVNFAFGATESLLRGQIFQGKTPHSSQVDFVFTKDSKAIVSLCEYEGEDADCKAVLVEEIRADQFPIKFELKGNKNLCSKTCLLSVNVRSQGGTADKINDLVSEYSISIDSVPSKFFWTVVATGLEACLAPNAGGFCVGN